MRVRNSLLAVLLVSASLSAPCMAQTSQTNGDERPAKTAVDIAKDTAIAAARGAAVGNPVVAGAKIILSPSTTASPEQDECRGTNCWKRSDDLALPPPPSQPDSSEPS